MEREVPEEEVVGSECLDKGERGWWSKGCIYCVVCMAWRRRERVLAWRRSGWCIFFGSNRLKCMASAWRSSGLGKVSAGYLLRMN